MAIRMDKNKTPKRWMKLDNAAKIFPAAKARKWKALFRLSAELTEDVDLNALELALKSALPRFPGFSLRLRRGLFWYYLEHIDGEPDIKPDGAYPCAFMDFGENKGFMFRVLYYEKRIAVEIFHALTDGTGGLCFLKTLVAEYLRLKYGADIRRGGGILDCGEKPSQDEIEDAYLRHAGSATRTRREPDAFYIKGTDENADFINNIAGIIPVDKAIQRAKEKGVTLTEFLASAMIMAVDGIQRQRVKNQKRLKPVKICLPINLRQFYPTGTLRNFSSYVNIGIDPKLGKYSFDEVLHAVHHHMAIEISEKMIKARFSTNVRSENRKVIRVTPLFIKNSAMKYIYKLVGERKASIGISNLGVVKLPDSMARYVTRMDFIQGRPLKSKLACAVITYNGKLVINFTRIIRESIVERDFFRFLVRLGIPVRIESNQRI